MEPQPEQEEERMKEPLVVANVAAEQPLVEGLGMPPVGAGPARELGEPEPEPEPEPAKAKAKNATSAFELTQSGERLVRCKRCGLSVPASDMAAHECPLEARQAAARRAPRWVPDAEAPSCMICTRSFSVTTRRHHCRCCGWVVCDACSPNARTLRWWLEEIDEPVQSGELWRLAHSKDGCERPLRVCTGCDDARALAEAVAHCKQRLAPMDVGMDLLIAGDDRVCIEALKRGRPST